MTKVWSTACHLKRLKEQASSLEYCPKSPGHEQWTRLFKQFEKSHKLPNHNPNQWWWIRLIVNTSNQFTKSRLLYSPQWWFSSNQFSNQLQLLLLQCSWMGKVDITILRSTFRNWEHLVRNQCITFSRGVPPLRQLARVRGESRNGVKELSFLQRSKPDTSICKHDQFRFKTKL